MRRVRFTTQTGALRAWVDLAVIVTVVALGLGTLAFFMIAYVNQQERRICGIIVMLDDRNQKVTPANEDQRQFIERLHRYRTDLGC